MGPMHSAWCCPLGVMGTAPLRVCAVTEAPILLELSITARRCRRPQVAAIMPLVMPFLSASGRCHARLTHAWNFCVVY